MVEIDWLVRIPINWNHATSIFILNSVFIVNFGGQKAAGYGLPDNKKEWVSLEIKNVV